jgi:hypothetical protein
MTEHSATPSNYEKYRQTHLNYFQKNKENTTKNTIKHTK